MVSIRYLRFFVIDPNPSHRWFCSAVETLLQVEYWESRQPWNNSTHTHTRTHTHAFTSVRRSQVFSHVMMSTSTLSEVEQAKRRQHIQYTSVDMFPEFSILNTQPQCTHDTFTTMYRYMETVNGGHVYLTIYCGNWTPNNTSFVSSNKQQ